MRRLTEYATKGFSMLQRAGRHSALHVYRLGAALYYIRYKLKNKGEWNNWLREHDISRVTAWEAIKLYEECPSEKDLEGHTITEAKIKFGIYSEFPDKKQSSSSNGGSGGGGGISSNNDESTPKDPEQLLSLLYHRLKGAAEVAESLPWTADFLYMVEVDDALKFCRRITAAIKEQRSRIKRPKQEDTQAYLDELKKA